MLDQLFSDEDRREQLLAGPMGRYLEVLATRLLEQSYSQSQARKLIRTAAALGLWLAERGLTPADAGKAELEQYLSTCNRTPKGRVGEGAVGFTRLPALLASVGVLCKPVAPSPGQPWLDRFQKYWTTVRGTTPSTNAQYRRLLLPFVAGLCREDEPDWSLLKPEYVTKFVIEKTAVARAEKGRIVTAVRAFLNFLAAEGIVPRQIVRVIPRIRRWRYADLPKRLSAEQLDMVLKACRSEQYGTLRDRAFIALLARLGVRAGELRTLHLDDIDWTQGLLHIRQSKTGKGRSLPLPKDAGELLVKYLREERPTTPYREVFITSITPRRPLGSHVITTFVKLFLKKLELDGPGRAAHCFRHTAASLMSKTGPRSRRSQTCSAIACSRPRAFTSSSTSRLCKKWRCHGKEATSDCRNEPGTALDRLPGFSQGSSFEDGRRRPSPRKFRSVHRGLRDHRAGHVEHGV